MNSRASCGNRTAHSANSAKVAERSAVPARSNECANAMFSAAGIQPRIEFIDMPAALIERYQYFTEARLERLRSAGYTQPFTTLEAGVAEYIQSYLGRDDPYH